jgi:DNA-binding beta-propeller fold protein YncE
VSYTFFLSVNDVFDQQRSQKQSVKLVFQKHEHNKLKEESLSMTNNGQSLLNTLQKHMCCVCHNQLSKPVETNNEDVLLLLLFCSKQCLEHYNRNNKKENVDLSLIADEVIDHIMMPLMDAKVLHYLKCVDSKWRTKIEEYAAKSMPIFKLVTKFGSKGSDNGQFGGPYFVACNKQGNIYVSDRFNHRIQIFDCNGQWIKSIGSYGSDNGHFRAPTGIAFNSKNHMFVVDHDNHRIQQFDENMQFINTFGTQGNENGQFDCPYGIKVDSNDNIFVADSDNCRVQIFSKDGNWKQTIGKLGSDDSEFNGPYDVAVCQLDGRIFVNDKFNQRIQVFSSDGKFLFKFGSNGSENGQFEYPHGLALSNSGQHLLVCDCYNYRILVFNAMNGLLVKTYGSIGSGEFNWPSGICISPSGKIIVSDIGDEHNQVQVFE